MKLSEIELTKANWVSFCRNSRFGYVLFIHIHIDAWF